MNNGLNAGVVLPDEITGIEAPEREASASLRVRVNGKSIDEGALWSLPGGAGASLNWLEQNLKPRGGGVLPGQLLLPERRSASTAFIRATMSRSWLAVVAFIVLSNERRASAERAGAGP